jgi:hypothetical protein
MKFKTRFGDYVREGDSIYVAIGDVTYFATIHRDEIPDKPDERDCGFWPSLDPNDAGYIGPKSKRTLERHMKRAQAVMEA